MFGGLENSGGDMHGPSCISIIEPEIFVHDQNRVMIEEKTSTFKNSNEKVPCTSSSTSSIGNNSDLSGISLDNNNVSEDMEEEAQSSYKGPLESMQALEDVLPIRKGISMFYNGKSKSFASLADAAFASSKELTKPENGYSKRRRNLLAYDVSWDKSRSNAILRSSSGAIAKRVSNATRNSLAFAIAMSSLPASSSSDSSHSEHEMVSRSPRPSRWCRVYPQAGGLETDCSTQPQERLPAKLSFSLADVQEYPSVTTIPQTLHAEFTETDPY